MKTIVKHLALALAALAAAGVIPSSGAAAPEKVTVPLSSPDKPCSVAVDVYLGSITVRGYQGRDIIVEAVGRDYVLKSVRTRTGDIPVDISVDIDDEIRTSRFGKQKKDESKTAGLKRLSLPAGLGLEIREEDNRVRVEAESQKRAVDLTLQVPVNSSLKLECYAGGDVVVENVSGEIVVDCYAGSVALNNVSGAAVVETYAGEIKAVFRRVSADKPMSFSTYARDIDVTLPGDVKAGVRLKSENGEVFSDFDVALDSSAQSMKVDDRRKEGGRYKVSFDSAIRGTVNGGGPEYSFATYQGDIYIRRAK